ncbi:MAG: hypothetical protein AAGB00_06860 [Planctomycetota bacterium]
MTHRTPDETQTPAAAAADMSEERPGAGAAATPTPPLRIVHLLAMMAIGFVVLMLAGARDWQAEYGVSLSGPLVVWVFAVAASASVLWLRWSWRSPGRRWLASPGDAASLFVVLQAIGQLPTLIVMRHYPGATGLLTYQGIEQTPAWAVAWLNYGQGTVACLLILVLLVFAFRFTGTWLWRLVFASLPAMWFVRTLAQQLYVGYSANGGYALNPDFWMWLEAATDVPTLLWLSLVGWALMADRRRSRPWTHWWGATAFTAPELSMLTAKWAITLWSYASEPEALC